MQLDVPAPGTTADARTPVSGGRGGPLRALLEHSRHPLTCLLTNPDIMLHRVRSEGAVGYLPHGSKADICLGGVLAPDHRRAAVLDDYLRKAADRGATPIFVHFTEEDAALLNERGFLVNQLGASYSLRLSDYDMAGKRFQQLRNKMNRAERAGIQVRALGTAQEFQAVKPALDRITSQWLAAKKAKPLKGLVTDFSALSIPSPDHRVYVAGTGSDVIAYVVYTRTWGEAGGWFHDLSRKLPDTQDGVMQLINQKALQQFMQEGAAYLHFGFTPLVEMQPEKAFTGSPAFDSIANWMARKGGVVYPSTSQRQYKMSWRPQLISPEYIAFPKGKAMKALWSVLRATNSI
jgi:lysylphosphatidylglycerol synthetase-like protein (DUF2156 family)